jgi:hypothetical protein
MCDVCLTVVHMRLEPHEPVPVSRAVAKARGAAARRCQSAVRYAQRYADDRAAAKLLGVVLQAPVRPVRPGAPCFS